MSASDVTPRDALMRLAASTGEAVAQLLETFAPGSVERGEVTVLADGVTPFADLPPGTLATSVSYVGGITGANVFVLAPAGARALAGAMATTPPEGESDEAGADELGEAELAALAEAANQAMAAAAGAVSLMIGHEVGISAPETRTLASSAAATEAYGKTPHATSTTFLVAGEECRLIQLVPAAFVMRMVRAIDELNIQDALRGDGGPFGTRGELGADAPSTLDVDEALGTVNLRVWAELGSTRIPLGRALELPIGAVVDLDRPADAPVDLFVNGLCLAQGQLIVTDTGEWAIVIDRLCGRAAELEAAPVAAVGTPVAAAGAPVASPATPA